MIQTCLVHSTSMHQLRNCCLTGISRVPVLLAGDLLSAIVQAAKIVGDEGFYLKGHLPENDDVVAWYVPFSNISEYESAGQGTSPRLSTATAFEHTLISPSGKWAIVTSHEDHMLLASNQEFTEAFEPLVSGLENQIFTFLENWRGIR
ncbi:MAG: hypothetical protein ACFB5Z_04595 [Elainellaceae cyanobacterium]